MGNLFWPLFVAITSIVVTAVVAYGRFKFEKGRRPNESRHIVNCADRIRELKLVRLGGTLLFFVLMFMETGAELAAILEGWPGIGLAIAVILASTAVLWLILRMVSRMVSNYRYEELRKQLYGKPDNLYLRRRL